MLTDAAGLVHWVFHYSHDKVASIESFKNKVVDHYNYGLLLVIDSDDEAKQAVNRRAIENLKSVADEIRDQMMVSVCDLSREEICRDLMVMFELEDHEFPLVRMLYRMSDNSPGEAGQEQIFYKFSFDREAYAQAIEDVRQGKTQNGRGGGQANPRNGAPRNRHQRPRLARGPHARGLQDDRLRLRAGEARGRHADADVLEDELQRGSPGLHARQRWTNQSCSRFEATACTRSAQTQTQSRFRRRRRRS